MTLDDVTVVIVPGLRDHVAEHWQTHLQAQLPRVRTVPPLEHNKLSCEARIQALEEVLTQIDGPVMLVAHSAGVMITVHWAWARRHLPSRMRSIHGALLATPADLERPLPAGYPAMSLLQENGWLPIPRLQLPFPATVAASTNDPLGELAHITQLATDWGSQIVNIGAVGHLNPAAGYGPWPEAKALIAQLL